MKKYDIYSSKFESTNWHKDAKEAGNPIDMGKFIVIGVEKDDSVNYNLSLVDVSKVPMVNMLSSIIYHAKVPYDFVLGMTYEDAVASGKAARITVPARERVQNLEKFLEQVRANPVSLTNEDKYAIQILEANLVPLVAESVYDALNEAEKTGNKQVRASLQKTALAKDCLYNRIGLMTDDAFVGKWTERDNRLRNKLDADTSSNTM